MNITDVDDKIIKAARKNYLFKQYLNLTIPKLELLNDVRIVKNAVSHVTDDDRRSLFQKYLIAANFLIDYLEQLPPEYDIQNDDNLCKVRILLIYYITF